MQVATVNVEVDQEGIRKEINKRINEVLMPRILFVDIETLERITSMSRSSLERDILSDKRMQLIERRKDRGKRYWVYDKAMEIILEIVDEW